jgi:uncharacterized membrane protein YczE
VSLVFGLALFAGGIVAMLETGLGLSPWDVLSQGIAERTALSFGTANVAVALLVLLLAWRLGARIGPGTVANAVLIGFFVDVFVATGAFEPVADAPLGVRAAVLVGAILVIGAGSAFYIGAGMGAGPRDSLMLVSSARSGRRIGVVRAAIEIGVTVLGFALGGTVGVGTVAFAFGIGPSVELAFWLLARTPWADTPALPAQVGSGAR